MLEETNPRPDVLTLDEALADEFAAVGGAASGDGLAALCLSGGGIRSAAFSLGVVQALARHRLLGEFHYLSTVSGGGYTGCFLSALIHAHGSVAAAVEELGGRAPRPIAAPARASPGA